MQPHFDATFLSVSLCVKVAPGASLCFAGTCCRELRAATPALPVRREAAAPRRTGAYRGAPALTQRRRGWRSFALKSKGQLVVIASSFQVLAKAMLVPAVAFLPRCGTSDTFTVLARFFCPHRGRSLGPKRFMLWYFAGLSL